MNYALNRRRGFTLVELLVVIAIIAILTGIITANFTQSKGKSRDAVRVSDLNQIQLSLEQYFDRCGVYPDTLDVTATSPTCPSGITLQTFIRQLPTDPSTGNAYDYVADSTDTSFILHTTLEYPNPIAKDGIQAGNEPNFAVTADVGCYDSADPQEYCVGSAFLPQ